MHSAGFFFLLVFIMLRKYRHTFLLAYWPLYCFHGHICIRYLLNRLSGETRLLFILCKYLSICVERL
jgi:hypothetical protein